MNVFVHAIREILVVKATRRVALGHHRSEFRDDIAEGPFSRCCKMKAH
jgi:hypothetical protein